MKGSWNIVIGDNEYTGDFELEKKASLVERIEPDLKKTLSRTKPESKSSQIVARA